MGWLVSMGSVILQASEWRIIQLFWERVDIFRTWAIAHFLAFYV